MINLLVCIVCLALGIYLAIWEHKARFIQHSIYLMTFVSIAKVFLFFGVGFFGAEVFKYFMGMPTLIF